jgi:hypothetical protein
VQSAGLFLAGVAVVPEEVQVAQTGQVGPLLDAAAAVAAGRPEGCFFCIFSGAPAAR